MVNRNQTQHNRYLQLIIMQMGGINGGTEQFYVPARNSKVSIGFMTILDV